MSDCLGRGGQRRASIKVSKEKEKASWVTNIRFGKPSHAPRASQTPLLLDESHLDLVGLAFVRRRPRRPSRAPEQVLLGVPEKKSVGDREDYNWVESVDLGEGVQHQVSTNLAAEGRPAEVKEGDSPPTRIS